MAACNSSRCCKALLSVLVLLLASSADARPKPLSPLDKEIRAQSTCVQTPNEYIQAFKARRSACVSSKLVFVIGSGDTEEAAKSGIIFNTAVRSLRFYSTRDNAEKYLRIGYPRTPGTFVASTAPGSHQSLGSASFVGITEVSNGNSFLQQVGYTAVDANITRVYVLAVFSRPPSKVTKSLVPTWRAVARFWEYLLKDVRGKVTNKRGVTIPAAVVSMLETHSFSRLTHCPAQCSFADAEFPSKTAVTAIVRGYRLDNQTCSTVSAANRTLPPPLSRYTPVAPSASDPDDAVYCDPLWTYWHYRFFYSSCTPEKIADLKADFVDAFNAIDRTDVRNMTLAFRALTMQNCLGSMSALFSGNGLTYSGYGGLLSPTGGEIIMGPFNITQKVPAYRTVSFCINGQGAPINGTCLNVQPVRRRAAA